MRQELKLAIINWLIENELEFQLANKCREHFREYIYNSEGQYLEFGGRQVSVLISKAIDLLYGGAEEKEYQL